MTLFSILVIK